MKQKVVPAAPHTAGAMTVTAALHTADDMIYP